MDTADNPDYRIEIEKDDTNLVSTWRQKEINPDKARVCLALYSQMTQNIDDCIDTVFYQYAIYQRNNSKYNQSTQAQEDMFADTKKLIEDNISNGILGNAQENTPARMFTSADSVAARNNLITELKNLSFLTENSTLNDLDEFKTHEQRIYEAFKLYFNIESERRYHMFLNWANKVVSVKNPNNTKDPQKLAQEYLLLQLQFPMIHAIGNKLVEKYTEEYLETELSKIKKDSIAAHYNRKKEENVLREEPLPENQLYSTTLDDFSAICNEIYEYNQNSLTINVNTRLNRLHETIPKHILYMYDLYKYQKEVINQLHFGYRPKQNTPTHNNHYELEDQELKDVPLKPQEKQQENNSVNIEKYSSSDLAKWLTPYMPTLQESALTKESMQVYLFGLNDLQGLPEKITLEMMLTRTNYYKYANQLAITIDKKQTSTDQYDDLNISQNQDSRTYYNLLDPNNYKLVSAALTKTLLQIFMVVGLIGVALIISSLFFDGFVLWSSIGVYDKVALILNSVLGLLVVGCLPGAYFYNRKDSSSLLESISEIFNNELESIVLYVLVSLISSILIVFYMPKILCSMITIYALLALWAILVGITVGNRILDKDTRVLDIRKGLVIDHLILFSFVILFIYILALHSSSSIVLANGSLNALPHTLAM
ncbi:hypothetical protein NEOKW01_1309 [Nematocida sp. AWRm80]|nr:hypothetical protein NEOKW01_1309 [Nematocida sp. AWRm80]